MENFPQFIRFILRTMALCIALLASRIAIAAETNIAAPQTNSIATTSATVATNDPSVIERQLRHYLKLQEQLHATLMAIEQARLESSLEARTNAEVLAARLEQLEQAIARQRELQAQAAKESGNLALWIGGGIVAVGLLALAFTLFFQTRGVGRLAQVADGFERERALLGAGPGLGASERLLLGNGGSPHTHTLLNTIERLERRVEELEGTASADESPEILLPATANAATGSKRSRNKPAENRPADQTSVLLGKGNVLLSLGKAEEALACFDQAAAASPGRAEAHLRRGMALERLRRLDDAVAAYDKAIQLNKRLTQAHLSKGGIFNQQERYNEALECYEQALKSEGRA